MKGKKDKDVYLQAITMIDPATGWIEICSVPEVRADLVANQVELAWLTSCLLYTSPSPRDRQKSRMPSSA